MREKGILLRESGLKALILILAVILGNHVPHFLKHDLTITASSIEKIEQIEEIACQMGLTARSHLKIDAGIERIGVDYYITQSLLETSLNCRHIQVEGIFLHFANADLPERRRSLTRS